MAQALWVANNQNDQVFQNLEAQMENFSNIPALVPGEIGAADFDEFTQDLIQRFDAAPQGAANGMSVKVSSVTQRILKFINIGNQMIAARAVLPEDENERNIGRLNDELVSIGKAVNKVGLEMSFAAMQAVIN